MEQLHSKFNYTYIHTYTNPSIGYWPNIVLGSQRIIQIKSCKTTYLCLNKVVKIKIKGVIPRHLSRSIANAVQEILSISALRRALYSPRPYVNWGHPRGRGDATQHVSIFRGSLSKGILSTWPAHCSCLLLMYDSIVRSPTLARSLSVEILCFQVCLRVTLHIERAHLAWNRRNLW